MLSNDHRVTVQITVSQNSQTTEKIVQKMLYAHQNYLNYVVYKGTRYAWCFRMITESLRVTVHITVPQNSQITEKISMTNLCQKWCTVKYIYTNYAVHNGKRFFRMMAESLRVALQITVPQNSQTTEKLFRQLLVQKWCMQTKIT